MATRRSPNYPSMELSSAIDAVKKIYAKEGRSEMAQEVAVKAMGYNTLNGASRSALGALRHYGLFDAKRGENNGKLSQRALTLSLMPPSANEYKQAVKEAALEPPLFRDLYQSMPDASDQNLIYHLVTKGEFTHDGAERCSKVFRAAIQFANLDGSGMISGYDNGLISDDEEYLDEDDEMNAPIQTPNTHSAEQAVKTLKPSPDTATFIIAGGSTSIRMDIPMPITESKWKQIEAMFQAVKDDFVKENGPFQPQSTPNASPPEATPVELSAQE
ncbi:MAG: hypothetical protein ACE5Q6_08915 [Dehalococcoidia bacterium]